MATYDAMVVDYNKIKEKASPDVCESQGVIAGTLKPPKKANPKGKAKAAGALSPGSLSDVVLPSAKSEIT
jgi:hypothetical protein